MKYFDTAYANAAAGKMIIPFGYTYKPSEDKEADYKEAFEKQVSFVFDTSNSKYGGFPDDPIQKRKTKEQSKKQVENKVKSRVKKYETILPKEVLNKLHDVRMLALNSTCTKEEKYMLEKLEKHNSIIVETQEEKYTDYLEENFGVNAIKKLKYFMEYFQKTQIANVHRYDDDIELYNTEYSLEFIDADYEGKEKLKKKDTIMGIEIQKNEKGFKFSILVAREEYKYVEIVLSAKKYKIMQMYNSNCNSSY